jgi:general secretion pathway protein A
MYAHHFGLTQDPFSIAPDPHYLFMSERHREALAHLLYGVAGPGSAAGGAGGGFVLLTGDIGTGKTTVCRCFLEQIPAGCHVAYIFNPKLTVTELLQSICDEFHITVPQANTGTATVKNYIDALNARLLQSHAAGHSCVLIIDEAQNLAPDVLEQLRLLTNLETNERKLLQIVLIGQPELRAMVARPELEQLAQRVIARFHLDALTEPETLRYIEHRLAVAGHIGPPPFDAAALHRIHRLARGVPRRINLLCGRALLGAWAMGQHRVDRKVVDKAAAEVFGPEIAKARTGLSPYLMAGLGLLAGAGLTGLFLWNKPSRSTPAVAVRPAASSASAPGIPAASAASASASSPSPIASAPNPPPATSPIVLAAASTPASPLPVSLESVDALLAQMPRNIDAAWRELAPRWGLLAAGTPPCQAATAHQLRCFTASNLTVSVIRQLDRPGILTLQKGSSPPVHALLIGLNQQNATLEVAGRPHTVTLVTLGSLWRGEFATFWRPPPGYAGNATDAPDGSAAAVDWLASRLALVDGTPAKAASAPAQGFDAALKARVQAFQRAHGLQPDGRPGPMTLMQINRATGVDEPRLISTPP